MNKEDLIQQLRDYLGIHDATCMTHGYIKHTKFGCSLCVKEDYKIQELTVEQGVERIRNLGLVADKVTDSSLICGTQVLVETPVKIYKGCFTIEKVEDLCWVCEFTDGMTFGLSVLTSAWLCCIIDILEQVIKQQRKVA